MRWQLRCVLVLPQIVFCIRPRARSSTSHLQGILSNKPTAIIQQPIVYPSLYKLIAGRGICYLRLGALSGAAAVGMHLYYLHRRQLEQLRGDKQRDYERDEELDEEQQRMFETTNLFHFVHSVVLLSVPLMRMPVFVRVKCAVVLVVVC